MAETTPVPSCPDGGSCHHSCERGCFRVRYCEPFAGTFPGDIWPAHIVEQNNDLQHGDPITAVIATNQEGR